MIDGTLTAALDASIDDFGTVCSAAIATGGIGGGPGFVPGTGTCAPVHVPEPSGVALVGLALAAVGMTRRYTRKV